MILNSQVIIFLVSILVTVMLITSSPSKIYASPSSGIGFYSPTNPPDGVKSLEPLIAKWWNWWNAIPAATATNWPECIKGDGGKIGNNQSVVFIGNGAFAVDKNSNARSQKCQISSNQLLYVTIYPGECSTGLKPHEGEFPDTKSPADLLNCALDENKVIRLMQAKVDGNDISSNIIRQSTSQPFNFIVPQDNAFAFPAPIAGGNNYAMAENYYLFIKPMPVGDHTIDFHVIRVPLEANQPVEDDVAHWDIKVVH